MKIYCDHCHEDITVECDKAIENYTVGNVVCPKCKKKQKRYISEADVLFFFGVSEVFYILLSLAAMGIFHAFGVSLPAVLLIGVLLVISYFASKALSEGIYLKAWFKEEVKDKVFEEDVKAIQRNITWQFMLFFAITITFLTVNEGRLFFGLAMPFAAVMTFVKFFLQVRNEKNT